jgi:replicative DNA helicase Mcm
MKEIQKNKIDESKEGAKRFIILLEGKEGEYFIKFTSEKTGEENISEPIKPAELIHTEDEITYARFIRRAYIAIPNVVYNSGFVDVKNSTQNILDDIYSKIFGKTPLSKTHNSSNIKSVSKPNNSENSQNNDTNDTNCQNDTNPSKNAVSTGNLTKSSKSKNGMVSNGNSKNTTTTSDGTSEGKTKVMIHDTNDTNDTNDSQEEVKVSSVSRITSFVSVFGGGALDLVFAYYYQNDNNPVHLEVVSKEIDNTYNYVKTVVNRNKEFFQEGEKIDGKKTFCLSVLGTAHCKKLVDAYEKKKEIVQMEIDSRKDNEDWEKELQERVKMFASAVNLKIENKKAIMDFNDVVEWDLVMASLLLNAPDRVFEEVINQLEYEGVKDIRVINLPKADTIAIEKIRANHIGKLISIEGRCVSLSSVRPIITNIKFECPSCGTIISIDQDEKKVKEPKKCSCGRRGSFKVISKKVEDIARIILEDLQEKTDNANTQRIDCFIKNGLTSHDEIATFTPGEELKITGITREVKKTTATGGMDVQMGLVVEINHAEKMEEEVSVDTFTEEEVEQFKALSKKVDKKGLTSLNTSFAPDVHGYEQHKNAIIMQCCTKRNDPSVSSTRNKISMLMIGDPGIAKTVLGKFAVSITPHSKMAAGGGSSAVGITASVVKEDESMGGYRVEPGAMVLAKELLFLDEMNNITDDDKPKLQQGMSEQMISINKANLHVNLKVQSGILATANPIKGHFVEDLNIFKQFNISSPILNRFDAIFIMRDKPSKSRDHAIAEIMIKRRRNEIKPEYDKEFLRKYFVYIRSQAEPSISDKIIRKIQKIYSDSRQRKNADVIINPRFIESLTRFMEASAKLRLSDKVEFKDIERSLQILGESHFSTRDWKYFQDVEEDNK